MANGECSKTNKQPLVKETDLLAFVDDLESDFEYSEDLSEDSG